MKRGQEISPPVFSLLVVAVSKGSIDLSRVDLSLPLPHRKKKKNRDAKNRRKKEMTEKVLGRGEEKSKYERGAAESARKMDFRQVRAGLNSRKMSKRVEE